MGKFFSSSSGDNSGASGGKFFSADGQARLASAAAATASTTAPENQASGEADYTRRANTNKKRLAEALHKLHAAGKVKEFNSLADQTRDVFTPEEVRFYGLDQYGKNGDSAGGTWLGNAAKSVGDTVSKIPGSTTVGHGLQRGLSAVDRGRAVVAAGSKQAAIGLDDLMQNKDPRHMSWSEFKGDVNDHIGFGEVYADLQRAESMADKEKGGSGRTKLFGVDALGASTDAQGKLTYNTEGGKWFARGVGVTGDVFGDPLTYVGGAGALKSSVKETIAREVGEQTAQKIAVHGLEGGLKKGIITEAEHQAVQDSLRKMASDYVERVANAEGKAGGKRSLSSAVRGARKEAIAGDVEALAGRYMDVAKNELRSGIKIGMGESKVTAIPKYPFGRRLPGVAGFDAQVMRGVGTESAQRAALKTALESAPKIESMSRAETSALSHLTEMAAPKTPGIHVIPDGKDLTIALRGKDGKLASFAVLSNVDTLPSVDLIHTVAGQEGKGYARQVLQAMEEHGINVADVIPNSEFTPEGRALFSKYIDETAAKTGENFRHAAAPVVQPGLLGRVKETRVGGALREAFVPRAALRDVSEQGASTLYRAQETASAALGQSTHDMALQLGRVTDKAVKALKEGAPELEKLIPEAAGLKGRELWNAVSQAVLEGRTPLEAVQAVEGLDPAITKALSAYADVAARGGAVNTLTTDAILDPMKRSAGARLGQEAPKPEMGTISGAGTTTRHGGHDYATDLFGTEQATREVSPGYAASTRHGGFQYETNLFGESQLPSTQSYVSRILTKEGEKLGQGEQALRLREALGVGPDAELRKGADLTPEAVKAMPSAKTIRETNEMFAEKLGLEPGTKLFEDDTLTAVALRSRASFEATTVSDMYQRLASEMLDHNTPMLRVIDPTDKAALKAAEDMGFKELPGKQPAVGRIVGPPEVMDELSKVRDIVINDASMQRLRKVLDSWNATWASYATNPLPFGLGFHSRNAVGNVVLAFMGGLQNPAKFAEAFKLQTELGGVRRAMTREGISFEEALVREGVSKRSAQLLRDMREHGVISSGFFADLDNYDLQRLTNVKDSGAGARAKAMLQDNRMLRINRRVGDVVENNARMALFMDAYEKGHSVTAAADRVKKYLFDYQDLTAFEKRNMKAINRFYTFTRKNLGVQLYTLAHDPWRTAAVIRGEQALFGGQDQGALPDYAKKSGFLTSTVFGKPQGTEGVAYNIDTPLDSAIKTLDPIAQAMTMVPGVRTLVPPQYRSNTQELTRSVLNLRAGGPQEFVNFLFESATGKDTFSGKDISDESTTDTLHRLSDVFLPVWSKTQRGLGATGLADSNDAPGMTDRLGLLQTLTGINLLPMTDKQRNQVAYVAVQDIQDRLDKLQEEGVDVPTYADLVRIGLAPDLSLPKDPRAKTASSADTYDATVEKVNKARAASGAAPIDTKGLKPRPTSSSKKGKFFG